MRSGGAVEVSAEESEEREDQDEDAAGRPRERQSDRAAGREKDKSADEHRAGTQETPLDDLASAGERVLFALDPVGARGVVEVVVEDVGAGVQEEHPEEGGRKDPGTEDSRRRVGRRGPDEHRHRRRREKLRPQFLEPDAR